jgi:hypothetical protein
MINLTIEKYVWPNGCPCVRFYKKDGIKYLLTEILRNKIRTSLQSAVYFSEEDRIGSDYLDYYYK